jgi:hypothetical protein
MNRRVFAASALSAALSMVLAAPVVPAQAQGMANPPQPVKDNMMRMQAKSSRSATASTPPPRTCTQEGIAHALAA